LCFYCFFYIKKKTRDSGDDFVLDLDDMDIDLDLNEPKKKS
jgi:hypothetical protein